MAYAWDKARFLVFITKLIERFSTVLKSPKVFKTGVCTANDVGSHNVRSNREVKSAKTTRHSHTHKSCLATCFKVTLCAVGIYYTTIFYARALVVNIFSVACNDAAANVANNFKHFVVVVHCIGKVCWCVVKLFCIRIVTFFKCYDFLHQRVREV